MVVEALIDTRIKVSLYMHDILHRFRARRGMGTSIMDFKFAQELSSIYQSPLFLVFLGLSKAYGTVDRDLILITMEGYGAGPRLCGLLETFWDLHQVTPILNGFYGPAFPVTRVTTQDGLVSLTLFNVVVDNVIRTWMYMTVEYQRVDHDGLGKTVGRCLGFFDVNYLMAGSQDLD